MLNQEFKQWIWSIIKKYKISLFFIVLVNPTLRFYFNIIFNRELYQIFIDEIIAKTFSLHKDFWLIVCFILSSSAGTILKLLTIKLYFNLEVKLRQEIKDHLFQISLKHSLDFFTNNMAGNLISKINNIINSMATVLRSSAEVFATSSIAILLSYKFFHVNRNLAIIFVVWLFTYCSCVFCISRKIRKNYKEVSHLETASVARINDCFVNINNVKIFAQENFERSRTKIDEINILRKQNKGFHYLALLHFTNATMISIICFAIFVVSAKMLLNGEITLGKFTFITSTIINMVYGIRNSIENLVDTLEHIGKLQDGFSIFNQPIEVNNVESAKRVTFLDNPRITFEHVDFNYNPTAASPAVFQDFNLTVNPGEKLALVGPTGSGKTTCIKLLLRLYDVQHGQIKINQYDISKDLRQENLRENISYIPQDPVLFHRSIKENLTYGCRNATMEAVVNAAKKAYCYDFIMSLEHQFDTLVGERGIKLSGGQRQRIAIARAILKNSPILILDEATSSLDSITENYIQQAITELMQQKTVIAIAHRLSTINNMDRIAVMHKGVIVENGTKEALLAQPNSLFKQMWDMQHNGIIAHGLDEDLGIID